MFNKKLKETISDLNENIKKITNENLKLKNEVKSFQDLKNKYSHIQILEKDINNKNDYLISVSKSINEKESELKNIKNDIDFYNNELSCVDTGIFKPIFKYEFLTDYEDSIKENYEWQKYWNVRNKAIDYSDCGEFQVNGSKKDGNKIIKEFGKYILAYFNSYCSFLSLKLNQNNYERTKESILKKYDELNKVGKLLEISIDEKYLNIKIEEIDLKIEYEIAKEKYKEQQRQEREILKEQEKLEKELLENKNKLLKERKHYENQLIKNNESEDIIQKIKEINKQIEDNDYRVANQRAGYLYCINCKDMKDNMIKLGITRRLNPFDRITELSNASHAFIFDVYGMVFSKNVFDLETKIHKYFELKRVNKVNRHKEFFYVTSHEVEMYLIEQGYKPQFNHNPINEPYILSMKGNNNEIK